MRRIYSISKLRSIKEILYNHRVILTEVNIVLFLRKNRLNVTLTLAEITNRGGGDYQFRRALAAKHIWVAVITR